MARNKITDLRDHLFLTIELLNSPEEDNQGMTVEKAKAVADVAQVIVNSAKVEVDFMRAANDLNGIIKDTGFMSAQDQTKSIMGGKDE